MYPYEGGIQDDWTKGVDLFLGYKLDGQRMQRVSICPEECCQPVKQAQGTHERSRKHRDVPRNEAIRRRGVSRKSAGNRPHVLRQRAWADCRIREGDVKRFGMDLPERKPGGLFLLEVLCDRRAREVEPGRADLRVETR
jgi:hypothetical protein